MGRDAQERVDALPWETHTARAVELLGQPGGDGLVLLGALVNGIEQEVGVEQHQLLEGPSRVSSVSAMLSKSIPRPRSCDFCRNGATGLSCLARPARTSSLTASL